MSDTPIINRNRITHKQAKEPVRIGLELQRAQAEKAAISDIMELMNALDAALLRIVEYVPPSWFADPSLTVDSPRWWEDMLEDKYQELLALIREKQAPPGERPN